MEKEEEEERKEEEKEEKAEEEEEAEEKRWRRSRRRGKRKRRRRKRRRRRRKRWRKRRRNTSRIHHKLCSERRQCFFLFGLLFLGYCSNKGMDLHLHPSRCISLCPNSVLVWDFDNEATGLNICK